MLPRQSCRLWKGLNPKALSRYPAPSALAPSGCVHTERRSTGHFSPPAGNQSLAYAFPSRAGLRKRCPLSPTLPQTNDDVGRSRLVCLELNRAGYGSRYSGSFARPTPPGRGWRLLGETPALPRTTAVPRLSMSIMSRAVDAAPSRIQPYLRLIRLDRPIGTWLCYWPCAWAIGLAAEPGHLPDLYLLGLCGLGALIVRGAGCTVNDMWDKDFDKSVERTHSRPIASGVIGRPQALVFLAAQLSAALGILLSLNTYSIGLGFLAVVPIIIYPLMKRFTYWPQLFLGLTFNFGALIGYAAVQGSCDWSIVAPLYASCIAWTIVYDTIYGHQDKKDDMALGLGSTSILMGENTRTWLSGFGAATVAGLTLTGAMADQTMAYYLAVALTAAHIANQVWTVDIHNPEDCGNKFRSNHRIGAIIFVGIIAGTLAKAPSKGRESAEQLEGDSEGATEAS